jgi:SAM-dependent methyltransferase
MKSDKEWLLWGRKDPLFAVASWKGRDKGGPNPWSKEEFYSLGRSDWTDFSSRWSAYGFEKDHCLEIGCGAGRITAQLAETFLRVTATDVSLDQVHLAKQCTPHDKVNFLITDGTKIPLPDASISAVFSCHVFQHFDSTEDAARVFQELHRVLIPSGSICIHLPLFELPASPIRPFLRVLLQAWKQAGNFRAMLQRIRNAPLMRGLPYELLPLRKSLAALGYSQIETHGFCMRSDHAWHEVLFARKASLSSTPNPPNFKYL